MIPAGNSSHEARMGSGQESIHRPPSDSEGSDRAPKAAYTIHGGITVEDISDSENESPLGAFSESAPNPKRQKLSKRSTKHYKKKAARKKKEVRELENELKSSSHKFDRLAGIAKEAQKSFLAVNKERKKLEAKISEVKEREKRELEAMTKELEAKREGLEAMKKKLAAMRKKLAAKDEELAEKEQKVHARDEIITALNKPFGLLELEKQEKIEKLEKQLQEAKEQEQTDSKLIDDLESSLFEYCEREAQQAELIKQLKREKELLEFKINPPVP